MDAIVALFLIHIFLGEQIYATTYGGLLLIVFGIVFNEYLANLPRKATGS